MKGAVQYIKYFFTIDGGKMNHVLGGKGEQQKLNRVRLSRIHGTTV